MKITKETESYNHRRYGKPWITKVDFNESAKTNVFDFGNWTGDHYNGGTGVLSIEGIPGEIIAIGQQDFREPQNSALEFYIVNPDCRLESIGDKSAAYKYYLGKQSIQKKEFTVILLYPEGYNDAGEPETYTEYAECDTPKEAIDIVRQKASDANNDDIEPDDFALIGVIEGRLSVSGE